MTTSLARPPVSRLQRRLISMMARDPLTLIPPFQRELVRAFEDLGDRAARAYRDVTRRRAVRQIDPGDAPFVDAISGSMNIDGWTETRLAPAYRTQYLRTVSATADTIRLGTGLAVNLPDETGRRLIREGGRRVGLTNIQGRARTSLFHALSEGRERGLAREALARHIKGRVSRGPWRTVEQRAQIIARTETNHAQRVSQLEVYGRMDVVSGVVAFDAQIGATDADCEERSGRVYSLADADIETGFEHPNGTLNWAPHIERGGTQAPAPNPAVGIPGAATLPPPRRPDYSLSRVTEEEWAAFPEYQDEARDAILEDWLHGQYMPINRRIYRGEALSEEDVLKLKQLGERVKPAPSLSRKTVFRTDIPAEDVGLKAYQPGQIDKLPADFATSPHGQTPAEWVAIANTGNQRSVIWEVDLGDLPNGVAMNTWQREFILPKGTRLEIISVADDVPLPQVMIDSLGSPDDLAVFGYDGPPEALRATRQVIAKVVRDE